MGFGILSTAAVIAAVDEVFGVNLFPGNPLNLRGGALDEAMTKVGIPDGLPQAAVAVIGASMARKYLNQHKMNPGIKMGRRNYLRLV